MSDTPRTDANEAESRHCNPAAHAHYGWKFARTLEREVEVLRRFGNKDCTAMADSHLESLRRDGELWESPTGKCRWSHEAGRWVSL